MAKRYLFFVSLSYSYSILRPLQDEIWKRGGEVRWFIEESSPDLLTEREQRLCTVEEVMNYDPMAVFAPGNYVYDFFPGIKVQVFHGYAMKKRIEEIDNHFAIRGWFDIYCTQGPSSTPYFRQLENKYGFFKVYETGWCKVDPFFEDRDVPVKTPGRPVILYSPTFTKGISSVDALYETIARLVSSRNWDWIITFHPKIDDVQATSRYKALAEAYENVRFYRFNEGLKIFRQIDVLLCDSSSITVEVMLLDKPVVTFKNTHPGDHLLNVEDVREVEGALDKALTRPAHLLAEMREYTLCHEVHRDGRNSARVLDAVDDFDVNYRGKLKPKPLNLFRKLKVRWKLKYFKW